MSQAISQAKSQDLFDAIEQSDFGRVWKLVKAGRGLQDEDPESGLTPLALAAELGHTEVVRILLENEADPDWGGSVTPLEAAVLEGNPEIVDLLIEAGADVNRPVEEGFTPLMSSVTVGNARIARRLLDAGAKTRLKNADGDTAIDLAEAADFEKLADLLRQHRAKPRPVPEEFLRPLELPKSKWDSESEPEPLQEGLGQRQAAQPIWIQPNVEQVAAALGNEASTKQTLAARPAAGTPAAGTPAAGSPAPQPAEVSSEPPELAGIEKFHALLRVEEVREALAMIEKGRLGVDERDRNGRSALMLASDQGAEELVDALLAAGAGVRAHDGGDSRATALVYAIRHDGDARKSIVRKLVHAGADLEARHGAKGLTPLMEAAKADVYGDFGSPVDFAPVTKLLIELGADLEAQDAQDNTVWQTIKRSAMATLTSSPYRRRLHQMLRVLESAGCHQMAGRI